MAKTAAVTLGENNYVVPQMSLRQIIEIARVSEDKTLSPFDRGASVAEIAFRHATPAIASVLDIQCSVEELRLGAQKIMAMSEMAFFAPAMAAEASAPATASAEASAAA